MGAPHKLNRYIYIFSRIWCLRVWPRHAYIVEQAMSLLLSLTVVPEVQEIAVQLPTILKLLDNSCPEKFPFFPAFPSRARTVFWNSLVTLEIQWQKSMSLDSHFLIFVSPLTRQLQVNQPDTIVDFNPHTIDHFLML